MGPPELFGPTPPEEQPAYGPDPIQAKAVVLVLGPGMARGFAHVGVFRALKEARIPIAAVYGAEMGAWAGALYGFSSTLNEFEWMIMRFKEDVFLDRGGFLGKFSDKVSTGGKLQDELDRVLGRKDLDAARVPVKIGLMAAETRATILAEKGEAAPAVRAALADPRLFTPGEWNGVASVAATPVKPYWVMEAKNAALGPVIAVAVAPDAELGAGAAELQYADLVIRPDLKSIGPMDFQKRTDAAFRGKGAILKEMPEIRRLVGLPPRPQGEAQPNR